MEGTNAIITCLVQTKSLERVLSPISAKLSQLVIQNEAFENGDTEAFPPNLTPSAMEVMKSSERLVEAGRNLCATSPDQDLQRQMPDACDSLSVAGQVMVTATQRMQLDEFSQEARTHLIQSAKILLEATLKVLLVSDDAEVRRITKTGQLVLQRLAVLTTVKDMKQLVPSFKSLTDSVMLFANMADKRQLDLTSQNQRDAVVTAVTVMKRSVPLLSSAMQTFIKFPENPQALSSKDYALGQMIESVNDVMSAVRNKQALRTLDESEEPGQFVTTLDQIVSRLAGNERSLSTLGGGFDQLVDEAVRHSMTVAHLSEEQQRSDVIHNCHQVLKERSHLSQLLTSVQMDREFNEASRELKDLCNQLTATVQELDESIRSAVLHLVVDTFKESSEPLERFVKAAMSLCKTGQEESDAAQSLLDSYIEAFHKHSDAVCQVARFVAAGCTLTKKVRGLHCCVNQLEKLDPEIVPAVLGCRLSNHASTEHLRMLKQEWLANIDLLIDGVDEVLDLSAFLAISENKLREVVEACKKSFYVDEDDLTFLSRRLVGIGRRAAIVAQKLVDKPDCVQARNTVMPYVHHLKKVVKATKSAASRLLGATGELRYHETLHARCDLLLKCVVQVRKLLQGQSSDKDAIHREMVEELELDDQDLKVDSDNLGDEEQNLEIQASEAKGSNHRPSEDRQKEALKCYVADLKLDHIADMSRAFVSSAVGNQKQRMDLLGNDLLKWTNHITDIARDMEQCILDAQKKRTLHDVSELLRTEVSNLLTLASQVLDSHLEQLENLHTTAAQWTNHMSYLLSYVDGMIDRWKTVSDKVADAAKLSNVNLVKVQMSQLSKHQKCILTLVDSGRRFPVCTDVVMSLDRSFLSQDQCMELENLTSFLSTQADALANTDDSAGKSALDLTSREWAAKAFCVLTSFVVTAYKTIASRKKISEIDCDNISVVKAHIEKYRAETLQIKAIVSEFSASEKQTDSVHRQLSVLDSIVASMEETAALFGVMVPVDQAIQQFYAPYQLILLQWTWVVQVDDICESIDTITGDFYALSKQLTNQTSEDHYKHGLHLLLERLRDMRKYTDHSVQACEDTEGKLQVQRTLTDLENVCRDLQEHSPIHDSRDPFKVTVLCRVWAVKCQKLVKTLKNLKSANQSTVKDVEKLCCSCPETVKHRQEDFLRQQQDKTTASRHTSNRQSKQITEKSTTQVAGKQKIDQTPEATENQVSLSGSLLDYAGVLGTTLVEFDESTLNNSPSSSPINMNTSLKRVRDSGTPHSYTPPISQKTPVDVSWKELARGPKTHHSTPIRPSQHSGYRANSVRQSPILSPEIERWEDENNAIVRVAKETTYLVDSMVQYAKGQGSLQSQEELLDTAKDVALNGEKLVKFAKILVEYSTDKSKAGDLQSYCQTVPTVLAQLHILSSVKRASSDGSAERTLVKTAQGLLKSVTNMLHAAEAVCVQGLRQPPPDALDETEAVVLATQWKRKHVEHRQQHTLQASKDALGLRKVTQCNGVPTLSQIMS